MTLTSRRLLPEDFAVVKEVHDRHHDFELIEPAYEYGTIIVERGDKYIGAGYLRPILEPVMILDKDASLRDKVVALRLMNEQAVVDGQYFNQNELRAWTKDPKYAQSLIKHLGYELIEGTSLRLRI